MPTQDVHVSSNFGLLQEDKGRWRSFGASAITNAAILALLLLLTVAHHVAQVKRLQATAVLLPPEAPTPPKVEVPKVKIVAPPKVEIAKLEPPKIVPPKPELLPPAPVKLDTPKPIPAIPPAPPKAVAPPPAPKVGMFESAKPTNVANNQSKPSVKSGGFGDPVGVTPNPNANRAANIAASGAFANAPGVGAGAGAARKGSVQGVAFGSGVANGVPGGTSHGTIASAGFSNGVIGGTPGGTGTGHGQVGSAGFGSGGLGGKPVQVAMKQEEPAFTPPVVLSEPKAQYTQDAQQNRIQGEVTLRVRFMASGQVEVVGVVNGLGHGLDEQARRVAENIRFKPATRNGLPVDHTTLIHVTFQLA